MMQRCSELGSNPEAWQQLFRFGKNRLKVKKGPNGHYLEPKCRDELQKTLPAKAFDSLMSSVATWMTRLDEKDNKARREREAAVKVPKKQQSEPPVEQLASTGDGDNNELKAVVDLCSDGDEQEQPVGENKDLFDSETVLSQSSVIVIDDDLGEVNLRDFADHVEGKLDEQTLRKKNQTRRNTTHEPIEKGSGPPVSDTLRRSLKTYANRRKSTAQRIGEALREAMTTTNDPKILREVNREACREAGGQKSRRSDCQVTKVDKEVNHAIHSVNNGDTTLMAAGNSEQKAQIVTEPTAYYNLVATKPGVELESKSEPEMRTNAKENDIHVPQIRIRTDLGPDPKDVIRVRTDLLLNGQSPVESLNSLGNQSPTAETLVPERTANKRILSEAQSSQLPAKRPALESSYPQFGSVAASSASSPSQLSISVAPVSSPGYPTGIPQYQGNPAAVRPPPVNPAAVRPPPVNPTPARAPPVNPVVVRVPPVNPVIVRLPPMNPAAFRPPPVNPAPAPPVVTVQYKLIPSRPAAPVISTSTSTTTSYQRDVSNSCQANVPIATSHSQNSVNSTSTSSSGYPSGSHMYPSISSTTSHQPNNLANCAPVTNPRPLPAPSPIIPMMNNYPASYQYQPAMPMPAAPVRTAMYPPSAPPAAPFAPSTHAQVPVPVAAAPATAVNGGASMVDPRTDLAHIMELLSEVEMFAFNQENQEAFHLVSQLRNSLQMGAKLAYRR